MRHTDIYLLTKDDTIDFLALENLFHEMPGFQLKGDEFIAYINKIRTLGVLYVTKENKAITSLVGFYANDRISRVAYLSCIVVTSQCKGSGIAQLLFDKMCTVARLNTMTKLRATVLKDNERAIAFYKKNKMLPVDVTPDGKRWFIEKDLV